MFDGADERPARPRFIEAYPCFNMVKGKSAAEQGREVCEFADVQGRIHGLARFGDAAKDSVVLEYDIALPGLSRAFGSIQLDLVRTPNGVDCDRTITRCPQCNNNRIVLVFLGEWACPKCHSLIYRCQALNKDNVIFQKWNALDARISGGRPKGMHKRNYEKLVIELHRLEIRKIENAVDFAHSQDQFVIASTWRELAPHHRLFFI